MNTFVSLYALKMILHVAVTSAPMIAGYTVRPGYSNGLFLHSRTAPCAGGVGCDGFKPLAH
jgi:hypothetical protein